jgi:hypothetical protein
VLQEATDKAVYSAGFLFKFKCEEVAPNAKLSQVGHTAETQIPPDLVACIHWRSSTDVVLSCQYIGVGAFSRYYCFTVPLANAAGCGQPRMK